MTTATFGTALKRMQAACNADRYPTYIEACASVAEEMVAEATEHIGGGLLEPHFRSILVAFGEQVRKHGGKEVPGSSMPNGSNDRRNTVLVEEVGEVADALNELNLVLTDGAYKRAPNGKPIKDWTQELRKELVDVATVAVAWLYWLDQEEPSE